MKNVNCLILSIAFGIGLAAQPPQSVKLPPFSQEKLPNGATVYLMEKRDVPLVHLIAVFRGGAESDPEGKAGLASLTAELLRRGTRSRSAEQFAEQSDFIGAEFSTSVDAQATYVSMNFLSKDAEKAVSLTADAILNPGFPVEEVKRLIGRRLDGIKSIKDNPNAAIGYYYDAFVFGPGHPYGHPRDGDEKSLRTVSREDVASYFSGQYTGANLTLIAAGDFDSAAMRALLAKNFQNLPKGRPYQWRDAKTPASLSKSKMLLIDKPDATQTYFRIGQPGIAYGNPDRVSLQLVNTLFGGRFTSMLNDELRVNSGLTYGAGCSLDLDRLPGMLTISTYTKTDSTTQAMDLALEVLKGLRERGLSAGQLSSAKAYTKGTYPPRNLETAAQLANVLARLAIHGLGRGEIDDLFSRIDAVSLEKTTEVIQRYYGSTGLYFVVLGNAAKIRDAVKKYAADTVEVSISTPGFATQP